MSIRQVSPSEMNLFFQCPYKWKLIYLDKVPKIKVRNEKAELGSNIHDIIAKYYSSLPTKIDAKSIEKHATRCFNTYFEPYLVKFDKQAKEIMKNFVKFETSCLGNYMRPVLIEKYLKSPDFKGKIDYFDGKNLIDWKTGAIMQIGYNEMRQGKIYEVLLRYNGYIKDGQKVNIMFATLKNGRILKLPLVTLSWLMEQKRRMERIIKSGRFQKIRSPLCNWGDVQLRCEMEGEGLWEKLKLF